VPDLCGDRGSFGVHGVGDAAQSGHRLRPHPDLTAFGAAFGCDGTVGNGRHADTTGGMTPMEFDELVADLGISGHALERRGLDHAISQRDRPELGWSEYLCFRHEASSISIQSLIGSRFEVSRRAR
jgi:hypothetical protein